MQFGDHAHDRHFQELLAAYADGELDDATRAAVEAWLDDHPEAQAELETQFRFSRQNTEMWQASAPPSPGEFSWLRTVRRVHTALTDPATRADVAAEPVRTGRRWLRRAAVAVAAAAVLMAVATFLPDGGDTDPGSPNADDAVWVVAADNDVDIESIQDTDTELLVVGQPPLTGPIVWASAGEVQFEKAVPTNDGKMPQMMTVEPNMPMVVVSVAGH
jgi:hypothetical protein